MQLDVLAKRYGTLPSDIAKLDITDYQLNLLVAEHGIGEDIKQQEKLNKIVPKSRRR